MATKNLNQKLSVRQLRDSRFLEKFEISKTKNQSKIFWKLAFPLFWKIVLEKFSPLKTIFRVLRTRGTPYECSLEVLEILFWFFINFFMVFANFTLFSTNLDYFIVYFPPTTPL